MKIFTTLLFIVICAPYVSAKPETNHPPLTIAGKWKLTSSQLGNKPLLPAWCSIIGEIEFKSDGSYFSWVQSQSDHAGKIQTAKGTWKLNGRNLVTILEGNKSPESCMIDLEENKLIIKQDSPEYAELHYKRAIDGMGDNQIEGLKFDYRISFPTQWSVILPESISELPAVAQESFGERKLRAIATSPDNEVVITLFASCQKRSYDNIDIIESEQLQSIWIKTKEIGGRQWRIQKVRNLRTPPGFDVYIASTYYFYKTVILNFEFIGDHASDEDLLYDVLNSYAVLESGNENDLRYGKLVNHTCGEPIMYRFADSDNSEASVLHYLYDVDTCSHCGKQFKK